MRGAGRPARLQLPLIPLLLALLALMDLRTELQLLLDHFTITSLVEIPRHHPLAMAVLLCTPWLWNRSR
ncbi:hypothetical protein [Vulcanococcus sp. Clear-D1]|jgi:hypothetical protein|uniref:hypothetical protein n=1 Tax=Vulcanococcus sp. Clear-D1 TaxID=2766970 RepID=UPI0019B3D93F|nr:hypothetical protein [Vulcanococcus sp. Clear-D1]MBD1193731.1 hypothetical protein [Vulcanococcus sp. Clear-D1]